MTGGGYEVHPPSLRRAGSDLESVAQHLSAQWEALRTRSAAMGDIFGDDDVGGLIGMSYQVAEEIAAECLRSVIEGLRGFGAGLDVMAERYDLAEQDNLATFNGLSW